MVEKCKYSILLRNNSIDNRLFFVDFRRTLCSRLDHYDQTVTTTSTYMTAKRTVKSKPLTFAQVTMVNHLRKFLDCNILKPSLLAVPGAVIEPLHVRDDGIALTWRPPLTDDSTTIFYYLIEWTISNKTFSANVTADKLFFEVSFHDITVSILNHIAYYHSFPIRTGTISSIFLFELLATTVSVFRGTLI